MNAVAASSRVIFIDLVRAFAVIMMVQGHTIDVFLAKQHRDYYNIWFNLWNYNRGMTAPLFLFGSGMIINYLFHRKQLPWKQNPRVKKGIQRFFLLLFTGYLIKYPTPRIFDLKNVPAENWVFFLGVDVLQCIAFGVLFIVALNILAEEMAVDDVYVFAAAALLFVSVYPFTSAIQWTAFLPDAIAGYFYTGTGSNFPLFPWLCYMFLGAVMGKILARRPQLAANPLFAPWLFLGGLSLMLLSNAGDMLEVYFTAKSTYWTTSPNLVVLRVGYVLIINSVFIYAAGHLKRSHKTVFLLARHTLFIYVAHMVLLYGSPWTLGAVALAGYKFTPLQSVLAALEMLALMTITVYAFDYGQKALRKIFNGKNV